MQRIVTIADLHVGSRVALAIPEETPKDVARVVREQLYVRWKWAVEQSGWKKPDALILLGDAIEGPNRCGQGLGLWTTDMIEQIEMAKTLIEMWEASRIFVLRGSRYHVDAGGGMLAEEWLGRLLGAEPYPGQEEVLDERKQRSGWHWYLRFGEVTFHCQHKIAVSRVFHYQTTPTARQLLQMKLNDHLRHEISRFRTKVVLRAHAHYYNGVEYSGSQGYVVPGWKALDDWMIEKGAVDISPDVGFLGFTIEGGEAQKYKKIWGVESVQPAPLTVIEENRENG